MRAERAIALLLGAGAAASSSFAQDSVASTVGGNDALTAYEPIAQRVRFIVDLVGTTTSWGGEIAVGPLLKASRSIDAQRRTQILGASAISADALGPFSFNSTAYITWTTAGAGINPSHNGPPTAVQVTGFDERFVVAMNGLSEAPTEIVGALVGRDSDDLLRLYVERVMAVASRTSAPGNDTATVSLGGADAGGGVHLRADAYNGGTILGQNIVRVDLDARASSINALQPGGSTNSAIDGSATSLLVNNGGPTVATPTGAFQATPAPVRHSLALDFAEQFRAGPSAGASTTTMGHVDPAIEPRGNPTYSVAMDIGGDGGAVGLLARATPGDGADTLAAFALDFQNGGGGPFVAAGSRRHATMPSPITGPGGFSANVPPGNARFAQYLNQTPFRGGSGHVGVGRDAQGNLILAATATDNAAGEFIAVARFASGGTTWTVAARAGQSVLDGANGASIGALISGSPASMSAPAVDLLGNIYFTARWMPTSGPGMGSPQVGLFRAVNLAGGYQLERLLTTGQGFFGANSASFYLIAGLALADGDSVASGATHGGCVLQAPAGGTLPTDPASVFAFGGVVVNATIEYLRQGGVLERYEALMFVGPRGEAPGGCLGDIDGDNDVDFADLNILLGQFNQTGQGLSGDLDEDGDVDFADLNLLLGQFNVPC